MHQLQQVSPSLLCSIVCFFSIPQQDLSTYLSFRFLSIVLSGQPRQQSPQFGSFLLFFFFFFWLLLCLVVWPRLGDSSVSQNPKGVCTSRFSGQILGCEYTTCSDDQIQSSYTIPCRSPCPSNRVLYSFCASLLHSLIMWLVVSFLSPHNLHLLFCCVLSLLALIWLVLMALFWAAIRRDSVSFLMFPFRSHVHGFSCEMSLVSCLKRPYSCFSSHFYFLYNYYYF